MLSSNPVNYLHVKAIFPTSLYSGDVMIYLSDLQVTATRNAGYVSGYFLLQSHCSQEHRNEDT